MADYYVSSGGILMIDRIVQPVVSTVIGVAAFMTIAVLYVVLRGRR